jgi:hypothetical protein
VRTLLGCGVLALVLVTSGAALLTERALRPISQLTRIATIICYNRPLRRARSGASTLRRDRATRETINELIATVERTLDQQRQLLAIRRTSFARR